MGLGTYPTVTFAQARQERDKWAAVLARGVDPISQRQADREAARAELDRTDPPLLQVAHEVLTARKARLRREGKAARWMSPLERHVFPKIGNKPISQIHQRDIHAAIEPIWRTKHPTAQKAVQRLAIIFRQGKLVGYDCDPFTVEAAKHMLGDVLHKEQPIPATPWQDIPDLYARLDNTGVVAACLQFMILTCVRAAGCRGAQFSEIDGDVWTVPAERMKGTVATVSDFRVLLCPEALRIVDAQRAVFDGPYLFPGHRGRPITDVSVSKRMKDMGEAGRPHGFRTSFRSWVQDTDACGFDVAETVLAHTVGNKVERAYARSDLLDRRRVVTNAWSDHVTQAESGASVVRLR